jgi:hypothetical protein
MQIFDQISEKFSNKAKSLKYCLASKVLLFFHSKFINLKIKSCVLRLQHLNLIFTLLSLKINFYFIFMRMHLLTFE